MRISVTRAGTAVIVSMLHCRKTNQFLWMVKKAKGKKVKSLCLTKHHAMKTYWGGEV
jgi:hypothetical protein